MSKRTEFIFRREDPFEIGDDEHWDNEDMNTISAKKVFNGYLSSFTFHVRHALDDCICFDRFDEKLLNYDIVSDIDGYCYVRTIEVEPGRYYESWREPTDFELDEFIKFLKEVYASPSFVSAYTSGIETDVIYHWYLAKRRDSKINDLLK